LIIDFHVHVSDREGCTEELLKAMDENGIDMAVIFDCGNNETAFNMQKAHPDRFIPFGYIRWGADDPSGIDELVDQGAKGLKVIRPTMNYNDPRLFPYYAKAEEHGLPTLMHTGIVARGKPDVPSYDDTSRMQAIWLDGPCRMFPRLNIIVAHMGNPAHEDAGMMARWHPNFYYDLSGSSLLHRSHQFFRELFWWDKETRFSKRNPWRPFEKMVFATDEPYEQMHEPMAEQRALLEALDQPQEIIDKVFGGTAARLLGLDKP